MRSYLGFSTHTHLQHWFPSAFEQMIIISVMLCRKKKQHVRFLWPTPKPLIKTLQLHHMKTSNHPSIFWAVHVIWDQAFVGMQHPELTIVPPIEGWGGGKKKSHYAASFTFTLMSVTWCSSPRRFFFFPLVSETCWSPSCWLNHQDDIIGSDLANGAQ